MPSLTLKEIARITGGKLLGIPEVEVESLETDSRRMRYTRTAIFIAIRGERHDGHNYIEDLILHGLKNFLVDRAFQVSENTTEANFVIVENTMSALQALGGYHRKQLKCPVVAITGSNGKTMLKEWLFQALGAELKISRSPKSYNSQLGVPMSLWMIDPDSDMAIIEAGISQPGEMQRLADIISPETGIFTNIGQAHQENFVSLRQKVKEKLKLFTEADTLIYCMDHELIADEISNSGSLEKCRKVSWSRKNENAFVYFHGVSSTPSGFSFNGRHEENEFNLCIPFHDEASLENCMHLTCLLIYLGYNESFIAPALMQLSPVEMRLEQIHGTHGNTLINDSYNSDVNSLRIALDYQSILKQHQHRVIILSDIQQTGIARNALYTEVKKIISSYNPDMFIGVGQEISGMEHMECRQHYYSDTQSLIDALPALSLSNSSILIKGARKFEFERVVSALSASQHTTVLEINLNHLVSNLNYFRGLLRSETAIMVMVKALSYGSGTYEIANVLQHQKVDYLGVAFADEGALLREKGISLPIMVMSPTDENYEKVVDYRMEPEIFSLRGLKAFEVVLAKNQIDRYPVHIKIDSGMHRLGFLPEEVEELAEELNQCPHIHVKAIFTHLAAADDPGQDDFTKMQLQRFARVYEQLSGSLGYLPMRHALNSAGIERFPEAHFDMVRLGIGLHGISVKNAKLKAVSSLKSVITQVKDLPEGETVGYNRSEKLHRRSRIAIVPVGYADGLDRKLGNRNAGFFVKDYIVPIVGDVCMDMCMLDVTGTDIAEGDQVIVFGEENPICDLARKLKTIPYEILTSISERVQRVYIDE